MINVNIRGVFLAMQASVALMKDGGRVILSGLSGGPNSSLAAAWSAGFGRQ